MTTSPNPWENVKRQSYFVNPGSDYSGPWVEWDDDRMGDHYDADDVDAARAEVERQHAAQVAALTAEIADLRARLSRI